MFRLALVLSVLVWAQSARADSCPDGSTLDKAQRRSQAEHWFSRGEQAIKDEQVLDALRAFQCSLRLIPHGFTAYNLGQIAERVGDLELAINAYEQYLLLTPGAADKAAIDAKLAGLRERMAKLPPETPPTPVIAPPASPPPQAPPPPAAPITPPDRPVAAATDGLRMAGWVSLALGGALTTTAVVLNLGARDDMSDCRALYNTGDVVGSRASCNSAHQKAYASYALFGVGAAAGATALVLFLLPTSPATVAVTDSGLSLAWRGRF